MTNFVRDVCPEETIGILTDKSDKSNCAAETLLKTHTYAYAATHTKIYVTRDETLLMYAFTFSKSCVYSLRVRNSACVRIIKVRKHIP